MGTLRKERGKWIVDFRLPRGLANRYGCRRFRRSYVKKALAEKIWAIVNSAIATRDINGELGRLLNKQEVDYTVQTFYDRWIEEYCRPRLEVSTVKRYGLSFKTINQQSGSMPLSGYNRAHLHSYIQSRTGQVVPSTINKDIIAIKKMFSYAFEVGAIESNPLTRFPTIRVQEKARRIPTLEEFYALVEAMPDPALAAMVAIIGETGIRRSEAINLEWKHVDLRNANITLERTKGKRVRTVPLSAYGLEKLRRLTRFVHCPFVFCHQISGDRWLSPDKTFRKARPINLNWITFHTLRHMRATLWLHEGLDIRIVKDALGHQSIQTTMIYVHGIDGRAETKIGEAQKFEKEGLERDAKKDAK